MTRFGLALAALLLTAAVFPTEAAIKLAPDEDPSPVPAPVPLPSAPQPRRAAPPARPDPRPPPEEPQAELGATGWMSDVRRRCRVWVGDPQPGETVSWSGPCRGGVASGDGELLRQMDGQVSAMYRGEFVQGRLNGPGIRISANGDRLECTFVDGRATGRGELVFRSGGRYEGLFRDDLPQGRGVRTWADGARYEGDWVAGKRTGPGQQIYPDGARYAGGWRDDLPHGRGAMLYANGDMYDGDWVSGRRTGRGTFRWFAPGRSGIYEGEWRDDLRNGSGREFFAPENAVFEGTYANDRPHGRGVYVVGGVERFDGEVNGGCMRAGRRTIGIGPWSANCR